MSNENGEKKRTWAWLKDKFADATVNIMTAGILLLVGGSIILSATNEYRRAQDRDAIERDLIDRHNKTVSREGELIQAVEKLKQDVAALQNTILMMRQPLPLENHFSPAAPSNSILNDIHPSQKRLDWEKSNLETYKK